MPRTDPAGSGIPRRARTAAAIVAVLALGAGCTTTTAGRPTAEPGAAAAPTVTVPAAEPTDTAEPAPDTPGGADRTDRTPAVTGDPPADPGDPADLDAFPELGADSEITDDEVGLRPDADEPSVVIIGATDSDIDRIAAAALEDLFAFYTEALPEHFGVDYHPPTSLVSYDATDPDGEVCDESTYDFVNAFYDTLCDTIAYDRAVLLPDMTDEIGVLATAVIMSHEVGHQVQDLLGVPDSTPTLVLEQQADCYAGAYWRWVADGNSSYFLFNATEGIRQLLLALFQAKDPVEEVTSPIADDAHGNGFDRTLAATLGYTAGPTRCHDIDTAEISQRGQEFPFDGIPVGYGNVEITEEVLADLAATVDEYFLRTAPRYIPPTLVTFTGGTPPRCPDAASSTPVHYCPATNTVSYDLAELQRIGTPAAGWDSANGDFSAIVLLVTRYALAAQHAGFSPITGTNAGLQALCYTGTWATWMRTPRGAEGYQLSPNDLDKAIYEIVSSPVAGSDVHGATGATIIERVQAFATGVTHVIPECFDIYVG